jgi:hypothetical protein
VDHKVEEVQYQDPGYADATMGLLINSTIVIYVKFSYSAD